MGIHRPRIKKAKHIPENAKFLFDQIWVNGSGERMPDEFSLSGWRSTKPTIGYKLAELNHYAVKSYEAYLLRRMRGNVNNKEDKYDAAYFALFDRNEEENRNVLRQSDGVKGKIGEMLADPVVRELQDTAMAYHFDRVEKLRETNEYKQWLAVLKEAGKVPVDKLDEVLFIQHLPKKWQLKVRELQANGVPDKDIAKMISQTQTAKKSETRAALVAAAGGHVALKNDTVTNAELNQAAATLRNPVPAEPVTRKSASPRAHKSDDNRVVLVSTVKNEGPYLLEWLAYHVSIGVSEFCIYSNDCTDGTNLMLNRLEQLGIVRHFDNPLGARMDPQRAAYSRAGKEDWVRSADYVLVVDADEFLNIHTGDHSVNALISACSGADAMSINWRLMGSSGRAHMDDSLVTERFTRGSTFDKPENGLVWGFKTLFRPNKFDYFGVHRPKFQKDKVLSPDMVTWMNGDGLPIGGNIIEKGWRSNKHSIGYSLAQVNHYAVKSREDFLLKRLRGTANSKNKNRLDIDYWGKYDLNANEDVTIENGQIAEIMTDWLCDPDLAALHRACLHGSRLALDYQLEVPEYRRFVETGEWQVVAA